MRGGQIGLKLQGESIRRVDQRSRRMLSVGYDELVQIMAFTPSVGQGDLRAERIRPLVI